MSYQTGYPKSSQRPALRHILDFTLDFASALSRDSRYLKTSSDDAFRCGLVQSRDHLKLVPPVDDASTCSLVHSGGDSVTRAADPERAKPKLSRDAVRRIRRALLTVIARLDEDFD